MSKIVHTKSAEGERERLLQSVRSTRGGVGKLNLDVRRGRVVATQDGTDMIPCCDMIRIGPTQSLLMSQH